VVDDGNDLRSTLVLALPCTSRTEVLETFKLKVQGHKGVVSVQCANAFKQLHRSLVLPVLDGYFRLALKSLDLRELFFAYRILAQQRPWKWYLAVRGEEHGRNFQTAYWLISAPFQARQTDDQQRRLAHELSAFVRDQTDLLALTLPIRP